ncbi:carboxypeptidase family protein [Actinomycetospora succinea]|uniref:Carboxypeptidase family protein n=1 Tax=Actinomycetospora succinea TaxID=663603 RepID=A0A4R6VIK9_9PSEU|nr:carboxypeptidase-like regulatory domain-containing protein [Actinomycetospora succinea]TDQ58319.1 carboxypeptidase family protein [Actinomycetospora succinea]
MSDDQDQEQDQDRPAAPGPGELSPEMKRSNVRFALTLPLFFMIMFPLCYITALHLPVPHDLPVAVVGAGAAAFIASAAPALAGKFTLVPVDTPQQATDMIFQQTVKAAYVTAPPGQSAHMLVAGADGRVMTQLVPTVFAPFAAQAGNTVQTVDVAPLAPGDGNGIGLMFFMLIVCIVGFMTANILGNAAYFLPMRTRVAISAGVAVLTPIVLFLFMGAWLQILQGTVGQIVAVIALGAVTSFTVGLATTALVAFLGKWALFPGMLVFVFLNIPSSNSAYPAEIVPPFFGWLSEWHLGAGFVDAVRAVLYLDGAGLGGHLLVIGLWFLAAVLLVGAAAWRKRAAAAGEADAGDEDGEGDEAGPAGAAASGAGPERVLLGRVHDHHGTPLPGAVVTLVDHRGTQTGRTSTTDEGGFRIDDLPTGAYTLIEAAPGHEPAARATVVDHHGGGGHGGRVGDIRLVAHEEEHRHRAAVATDGTVPPSAGSYGGS